MAGRKYGNVFNNKNVQREPTKTDGRWILRLVQSCTGTASRKQLSSKNDNVDYILFHDNTDDASTVCRYRNNNNNGNNNTKKVSVWYYRRKICFSTSRPAALAWRKDESSRRKFWTRSCWFWNCTVLNEVDPPEDPMRPRPGGRRTSKRLTTTKMLYLRIRIKPPIARRLTIYQYRR